jgi:hypothetical protein
LTGRGAWRIVGFAASPGGLAERLKAAVLKTAVGLAPTGGSNPSPSAKAMERWPSGLRRHPAKVLHRENRCRGFESRPLRQKGPGQPGPFIFRAWSCPCRPFCPAAS